MYRVRLQEIRCRGRVRYLVHLPSEVVRALGWVKGDELVIKRVVIEVVVDDRGKEREWYGILIYSRRDEEKIGELVGRNA